MFNTISMQSMQQQKDIVVLDVREEEEYLEGIIPGAVLLPLSSLQLKMSNLDKSTHYHVVCYSGSRSQMACMFLDAMGYQVTNVMGGMSEYTGRLVYEM